MEGALCKSGHGGVTPFRNLPSQEFRTTSHSLLKFPVSLKRAFCPQAQAQASGYNNSSGYRNTPGRVGFKDVYRRRDAGDADSNRRDGEMGRRKESSEPSTVELASHVDTVTSVQNPYVKHLVKLRQNAGYRNAAGCVLVVGSVPLREICGILTKGKSSSSLQPIKVLLVLEFTNPRSDVTSWAERIVYVSEPVMRKVAGVDSTEGLQGVGLLALPSSFCNLEGTGNVAGNWIPSPRRVLVLDGIQDPGNLGTLLRSAAAFAWDGVFMLPGGCDPFNEKALRASRGASFRLPIATGRWSHFQAFANMHKMTLYAADPDENEKRNHAEGLGLDSRRSGLEEDSIAIAAGKEALCLVLGSEGQGLSENAHRSCERVSIPMPGDFESLNVAVAGGILLYLLSKKIPVPKALI